MVATDAAQLAAPFRVKRLTQRPEEPQCEGQDLEPLRDWGTHLHLLREANVGER